ncbi:MAG TPA: peptide ABC transporter substrate-binding protein [Bacillota bacterium]
MKLPRLWIVLAVTLVVVALVLFKPAQNSKQGKSSQVNLHKSQIISYNLAAEPETLDPAKSTGLSEARVQYACFEGLAVYGPNDLPQPGAARKWTVSPDGKTYTFYLRENAKWSNGDPVTAADFEYAWKRLLDPKTAANYASNLYYVKNGAEYNTGKIKDPAQVGIYARDPLTLVVELKAPCSYFPALTIHPSLYPVNRKVVEANPDKWAGTPQTYVTNGPFKLVNWVHHEKLEFVPNPYYWNRSKVKLDKLICYTIEEQSTGLTMFETGQLDLLDELPRQEIPRLEAEGQIKYSSSINTYYYLFNTKKAPFNDIRVRKALTLAIDRGQLIKYITKAGEKPALGFVPYGIPDAEPQSMFREIGGSYFKDGDLAQAKRLLAEAGYQNPEQFPTIEILYNTSETHKLIAEAIQEMWSKNLKIKVTLTNQEWKVYLQSREQGNFQVARAGWVGDYVDPMTFLDLWVSDNGNNFSGWSNPNYDQLIALAKQTADTKKRLQILHQAEKLLMDEMPIAPIYFYTRPYLIQEWVQGVRYTSVGYVDFSNAFVTAH